MKTKLLLLSSLFFIQSARVQAQCAATTTAAMVVTTSYSVNATGDPNVIKVCSTGIAYDTVAGQNRTWYLETGGTLYLKNNPTTMVYMKNGSTLINKGGASMIIARTEPTATVTNMGSPPVQNNTCTSVSFPGLMACPGTSIKENSLSQPISIYPNPAKNYLTVNNENSEAITCTFINAIGQKVKTVSIENGKRSIDVSDLNEGIYFINMNHKNSLIGTRKVIITR